MSREQCLLGLVAGVVTLVAASAHANPMLVVKCQPTNCTNREAVQRAFADVEAACPCDEATSPKKYKFCWRPIVRALKEELGKEAFPKACEREVAEGLNASLCGRPGFVLCKKIKNGKEACKVVDAEKCDDVFPPSSVCGAFTNCNQACFPEDCLPTTTTTLATTTTSTTLAPTTTSTTVTSTTSTTVVSTTTSTTSTTSTSVAPTTTSTTSSTSTTLADLCGNGVIDPGEECDGEDFGTVTCPGSSTGAFLKCRPDCTIDFQDCPVSTTSTTVAPTTTSTTSTTSTTLADPCGNGVIDPGEECDGEDFGTATCPGTSSDEFLKCRPDCTIDFQDCPDV